MEHDNFILFMGNHEYMFKQYHSAIKKNELRLAEIIKDMWLFNGASPTLKALSGLDDAQREEIVSYIDNLPIALTNLYVNNKYYYLVHSYPIYHSENYGLITSDMLSSSEIDIALWNRVDTKGVDIENRILVSGHTITNYDDNNDLKVHFNSENINNATYINIDTGCAMMAHDDNRASLCLLCLNDLSVKYYKR